MTTDYNTQFVHKINALVRAPKTDVFPKDTIYSYGLVGKRVVGQLCNNYMLQLGFQNESSSSLHLVSLVQVHLILPHMSTFLGFMSEILCMVEI